MNKRESWNWKISRIFIVNQNNEIESHQKRKRNELQQKIKLNTILKYIKHEKNNKKKSLSIIEIKL